jgi:two-component system CheB/CheR fusion protein
MPAAAIATGMVDCAADRADSRPPARLPPARRASATAARRGPARAEPVSHENALREVLTFLRTRTGRDFSYYKRATTLRRIARRMQVNGVANLPAYLDFMRTHAGEPMALLQDLLISVTNFFRDAEAFSALSKFVPRLFEDKGPTDTIRVWVPACATGEEAYSIAILLDEYARGLLTGPKIQIFASDLDEGVIRVGREALYPESIAAAVSDERLRRYFTKEHRGYRVRRELRECVLFALHDVLKDSPFRGWTWSHAATC